MFQSISEHNLSFFNFSNVDAISISPQEGDGISLPETLWEINVAFSNAKQLIPTQFGLMEQYTPFRIIRNKREFEVEHEMKNLHLKNKDFLFFLRKDILLNINKVNVIRIDKVETLDDSKMLIGKTINKITKFEYKINFFIGNTPYECEESFSEKEKAIEYLQEIEKQLAVNDNVKKIFELYQ